MSEIIKFPGNGEPKPEEIEKQKKREKYEQLNRELEVIEGRLSEMVDKVGSGYDELSEDANWQISELKVELAEMRERKFYSPVKRRKILEDLKALRAIFRTADALVEEYRDKGDELVRLARQLGILDVESEE